MLCGEGIQKFKDTISHGFVWFWGIQSEEIYDFNNLTKKVSIFGVPYTAHYFTFSCTCRAEINFQPADHYFF